MKEFSGIEDNRERHECAGLKVKGQYIYPGYDNLGAFPEWWLMTTPSKEVPGGMLKFDIRVCPECGLELSTELFDKVDLIWKESSLGKSINWRLRKEEQS